MTQICRQRLHSAARRARHQLDSIDPIKAKQHTHIAPLLLLLFPRREWECESESEYALESESLKPSTCSHARHTHKRCLENQKTTRKFQNTSREETTGGATTSCQVAGCIMQQRQQQQPQLGGMPCLASAMIMMIVIHWVNSLVNGQRMHISDRRERREKAKRRCRELSGKSPVWIRLLVYWVIFPQTYNSK